MTQQNDFNQRGDEAIKRSQENNDEKLCPFSFGYADGPKFCNRHCKLYRREPKGYECTFQELRAIAWNTKCK